MQLHDDDFTLLGLPQQYALDINVLTAQWKAAMGAVHPDKFAQAGAQGQRLAVQWSVRMNEAYQRLKHPLKRAAYLCELRGAAIAAENNTSMPAAFLMQQMQWREDLDDARSDAERGLVKTALKAQAAQYQHDLIQQLDVHNHPAAAAQTVRVWLFVDKFLSQIK